MGRAVVVDYGMGNLDSVRRALEECGVSVLVTDQPSELAQADHLVLPGVGAFPQAMKNLAERGLDEAMTREVRAGVPVLGICLGMQLMATKGTEAGGHTGLGWIPGRVERMEATTADRRIPHVGWNEVTPVGSSPLLSEIEPRTDFYFVHGFSFRCDDGHDVAGTTPYAGGFTSVVSRGAVHGVQFHPEKSQRAGFGLIRRFLAL